LESAAGVAPFGKACLVHVQLPPLP
jgi:hypothetical protein